jgi:Uma2 family endonuclease
MSVAVKLPSADRIIISNVSWETYESLLKDLENQSSPRLAYDQGVLEIMSPHLEHDSAKEILADIVKMTLEELDVDFLAAGSTTYKREILKRGFEPDSVVLHQTREANARQEASRPGNRSATGASD